MSLQVLPDKATSSGLSVRGGFQIGLDDNALRLKSGELARSLVLLGNMGSSIWLSLAISPEYNYGLNNPLD